MAAPADGAADQVEGSVLRVDRDGMLVDRGGQLGTVRRRRTEVGGRFSRGCRFGSAGIPCRATMATNAARRVELAAWAIVLDDHGRVLLVRENKGGRRYGLPGGSVEPEETPWAAAVREAEEETTLRVRAQHVVAVCSGPIGRRVWVVSFGVRCDVVGGEARLPGGDEIADVGWYPPDRWPEPRTVMGPLLLAAALRGDCGRCIEVPRPGHEPPGSIWPPDY